MLHQQEPAKIQGFSFYTLNLPLLYSQFSLSFLICSHIHFLLLAHLPVNMKFYNVLLLCGVASAINSTEPSFEGICAADPLTSHNCHRYQDSINELVSAFDKHSDDLLTLVNNARNHSATWDHQPSNRTTTWIGSRQALILAEARESCRKSA